MGLARAWIERYRRGDFGMPEVLGLSLVVGLCVTAAVIAVARLL